MKCINLHDSQVQTLFIFVVYCFAEVSMLTKLVQSANCTANRANWLRAATFSSS